MFVSHLDNKRGESSYREDYANHDPHVCGDVVGRLCAMSTVDLSRFMWSSNQVTNSS